MATTELEEVQALLQRVLPDPSGFAQRLLLQLMSQFGQSAEPGASAFNDGANAFYTAATQEDAAASKIVITPEQPAEDEAPAATNILLAAALGACECWGLRGDCNLCRGQGSAGWAEPVPELFDEFVGPALAKMSDVSTDPSGTASTVRADDGGNHQTVRGEDA